MGLAGPVQGGSYRPAGAIVTAWAPSPGSAPGRDPLSGDSLGHSWWTQCGRRRAHVAAPSRRPLVPGERMLSGLPGAFLALWVTFLRGRQENREAEPRGWGGLPQTRRSPAAGPSFRPLPARPASPALGAQSLQGAAEPSAPRPRPRSLPLAVGRCARGGCVCTRARPRACRALSRVPLALRVPLPFRWLWSLGAAPC